MNQYAKIKGLLIDVDDTLTRFKLNGEKAGASVQNSASLFGVLQQAGVELAGLSPEEVTARIEQVKQDVHWWHWADFILALGLQPKTFWNYAYDIESHYLEVTGPEVDDALRQLHERGYYLFITSNNPNDGILHKLRLAGLAHNNSACLFDHLFDVAGFQSMKWDRIYWQRVQASLALDPDELTVVGDNIHDDYELPHAAGISHSFIINRSDDLSAQNTDSVTFVQNFTQIANLLVQSKVPSLR